MSVDDMRDSLLNAPFGDTSCGDDDGVVELSLVEPGLDWRLQRLGPRWLSRASSSRGSSIAGDGPPPARILSSRGGGPETGSRERLWCLSSEISERREPPREREKKK